MHKGDSRCLRTEKKVHKNDDEREKSDIRLKPDVRPKKCPPLKDLSDLDNENDPKSAKVNWESLEDEEAKYHNPNWLPPLSLPPPYNRASVPTVMVVIDPKQELKSKVTYLEEQIKLEELYQSVINKLQKLKTGDEPVTDTRLKAETTRPPQQPGPSVPKGKMRVNPNRENESTDVLAAFPVTESVDAQGQPWRHHQGFDLRIIKE